MFGTNFYKNITYFATILTTFVAQINVNKTNFANVFVEWCILVIFYVIFYLIF